MANYFVHEKGICESEHIGEGTLIWAFAHVLPGAVIGKNCNICDSVFIENKVIIGDNVTIKCGVQLWDGVRLGNNVFVGPNATFTNDAFPRSKKYPDKFLHTIVEDGASIGANATILPGLTIGSMSMVSAGAVITGNVPPNAIVTGNPGRITGYVNLSRNKIKPDISAHYPEFSAADAFSSEKSMLGVGECFLMPLPQFTDLRGDLVPVEFEKNIPFIPKRQFFVYAVPDSKVRGEHAHKKCKQFMFAINGALSVVLDNGLNAREVRLDNPSQGLYLPEKVWSVQYKFTSNAILSVYASETYDKDDYIRFYDEYLKFFAKSPTIEPG